MFKRKNSKSVFPNLASRCRCCEMYLFFKKKLSTKFPSLKVPLISVRSPKYSCHQRIETRPVEIQVLTFTHTGGVVVVQRI